MTLAHNINIGERTQDVHITQEITFESMLLSTSTLQGLRESGFYKPSPIQLHGIPLGKCGFDLLLEAKSGTGKTAVFSIIALEKLNLNKGLQVIVLAPTREIAAQTCDVMKQIGSKHKGLQVEVVMGGLPVHEDISKFKKQVHIVVGSPGRLRHLIQDNHLDTSSVRLLVLDEADKLMEKSFKADINYIFCALPNQKQVVMSSATYPKMSLDFIQRYVHEAQHVCPDSSCVLLGVKQKLTTVKHNQNIVRQTQIKFDELLKILNTIQFKQCLIFCNYQARVVELHKMLTRKKWPAEQLYGQQEQTDRLDALKTLQQYKCRILIATDLAARGIDASNVDLVINFEPPFEWQTYLHRIGRAGRFGSYGIAITVLSEGKEYQKFTRELSSLKDTLNLTNLWEESNQNTQHKHVSHEINLTPDLAVEIKCNKDIENNQEDFWSILTQQCSRESQEIESFDQINKSFEAELTESQIDSFTDLVHSFTNSQYEKVDPQYKTIKAYSGNCNFLDVESKNEYLDNGLKDVISILETTTEPKFENKTTKSCELNKKSNPIATNCTKHRVSIEEKGKKSSMDDEKLTIDISKDLLDAGLPLQFGKQKSNNRSKTYTQGFPDQYVYVSRQNDNIGKSKKYSCDSNQSKNSKFNQKETESKKRYEPVKELHSLSNSYYSRILQNKMNNEESHSKQYNGSSETKGNIKKGEMNNLYSSNTRKKKATMGITSSSNNLVKENENAIKYHVWYKQFKLTTKQIELAIYLNEVAKI